MIEAQILLCPLHTLLLLAILGRLRTLVRPNGISHPEGRSQVSIYHHGDRSKDIELERSLLPVFQLLAVSPGI